MGELKEKCQRLMATVNTGPLFNDIGVLVVVLIWVIIIFSVFMSSGCRLGQESGTKHLTPPTRHMTRGLQE